MCKNIITIQNDIKKKLLAEFSSKYINQNDKKWIKNQFRFMRLVPLIQVYR